MKAKERFEILLEGLDPKMDGVVESVNSIHPRLDKIERRLETIESDG